MPPPFVCRVKLSTVRILVPTLLTFWFFLWKNVSTSALFHADVGIKLCRRRRFVCENTLRESFEGKLIHLNFLDKPYKYVYFLALPDFASLVCFVDLEEQLVLGLALHFCLDVPASWDQRMELGFPLPPTPSGLYSSVQRCL